MLGVLLLFLMAQMWLREESDDQTETKSKSIPCHTAHKSIRVIPRDKAC
jgi:hypothetical protein